MTASPLTAYSLLLRPSLSASTWQAPSDPLGDFHVLFPCTGRLSALLPVTQVSPPTAEPTPALLTVL